MKLAYLTNRYPAVSHSFIRREIEALESLGHEVARHSMRLPNQDLPDERDRAERERTFFILDQGAAALLGGTLALALTRPGRWFGTLRLALGMSEASPKSLFLHCAYLAEACLLARRLEKLGVTHLHCHFGTNPTTVARFVRRLSGITYSFTSHGPDEFDRPEALDLRGKIADARLAVGVSSFGRSQLMRWSDPKDWHRIAVVRCSVGEDYLGDRAPVQPNLGHTLTCVARLSAQKGLPLLLEAAALLARRGVDFELRLVGDGEMRDEIEAEIARQNLDSRVTITGWCDGAAVKRYLSDSRAMVMASFAEGLPVVIMEALALGRPVIATAIAGIPELVDEGCGWLVSAGSVEALADAMAEALAADGETLHRLGEEGRSRVAARHEARGNAQLLLDSLGAALTAEGAPAIAAPQPNREG